MPLVHRSGQRIPFGGIGFQQDHNLLFLVYGAFPPIDRRGRQHGAAGDEALLDQAADQRSRVAGGSERRQDDQRIRGHLRDANVGKWRVDRKPLAGLGYGSMPGDALIVRGAREHNLKNIDVELPRNALVVITGLSGSGKSSLAFDTIYAEGQRRYVESLSAYARQFLGLMDKPDVDAIEGLSPAISIEQKTAGANPRSTVGTITEVYDYLRLLWARTGTPHCPNDGTPVERQSASQITDLVLEWPEGTKIEVLEPRQFSFNSPYGACPGCSGLGTRREVNADLVLGDQSLSILEGVVLPWGEPSGYLRKVVLPALARAYKFDLNAPWRDLSPAVQKILLQGAPGKTITYQYDSERWHGSYESGWKGVLDHVEKRYRETASDAVREQLEQYMVEQPCPACGGRRLKPESLSVLVAGKSIGDVVALPVRETLDFFSKIPLRGNGRTGGGLDPEISRPILKEVNDRLRFLVDVGLDYLTLERSAVTLSGGEAQRIRLATQIGSRLVGVLYILDEPSIGLHQRDNARLLATLKELRDLGNTVLVVEHDEETIRAADYVVDLGPRAGRHGGEVVAAGLLDEVLRHRDSLTARYLRGELRIPVPPRRRIANADRMLRVIGARHHNLKDLTVEFPLGLFVAVTGVSGSGKSTLVTDILYQALARHFYRAKVMPGAHQRLEGLDHIDKVIDIDQSPIGRTPRSNPATYTGLFTPIRELYTYLPESKIRGYGPGRFSFNVKGGRCEACQGDGLVKVEMHFLPDVYVPCEVCKGRRYNRETLEVRYKGKSIADVLDMSVGEALDFFENQPRIRAKLELLNDVGLGYIHLGQSATTLSGGEAQRVKLATELAKRDTGRTLYILNEPTTGLHFEDVRLLLEVLHRLVDKGNTVVVIEHNLDVVKTADWVIDLGPEGGAAGGAVVAAGPPEDVARVKASFTGQYLRKVLAGGDYVGKFSQRR